MSLLLDALKKSEAQRRRGASPTIDLTRTPPSTTSPRRGSRWLAIAVAGVLLVAAAPWLWPMLADRLDRDSGSDGETGMTALESNAGGSESRSASEAFEAKPDPAPVAGASSQRPTTVMETAPEAASTSVAEGGAEIDSGNAWTEVARDPGGDSSGDVVEAEAVQSRPSMQEMRRMLQEQHEQRQQLKAQEQDSKQPAQQQQAPPAPASKPSEASTERSPSAGDPIRNFIRPWEMPQAQRAEFPELDLAVHLYAEQPADRFVLINGERYGEGQLVETGVRLVEILERGAVVEFAGYRILIE